MNIYNVLMLMAGNISLSQGLITESHGVHDKVPTSNQDNQFDTLEQWGFKLEGAYHSSNDDPIIPKGRNPCFFTRKPCTHSSKERENDLSDFGYKLARHFESMNTSSKSNRLEEILNDDPSTALRP